MCAEAANLESGAVSLDEHDEVVAVDDLVDYCRIGRSPCARRPL